jgi:predicted MPP superfamily phosphohydrolase
VKKKAWLTIISAISMMLTIWMIWGNVTVGITHYQVASNRLPAAFDHYKIAVVSDLHHARFGKNNSRLISLIEQENPDVIAITGDLIDSSQLDIGAAYNFVQTLAGIAPCYDVTGNHEAWIGEQYQELEKKLLDAGVTVLHDKAVSLTKDNVKIQIAGLDDPDFTDRDFHLQESILKTKLREMHLTEEYYVLLSHRPEAFNAYVSENIDLILSGHTHGGQIRLPFIGGLIAPDQGFFPKYDAGEYIENNTTMIVSRGIGNSVIPIRFNNRPEIVIVELISDR